MTSFDQFITSLRNEFGKQDAGRKFEVFCKWFLENDPEWSKIVEKVWFWDDYPNKWQRQDLGTDLVFRDKDKRRSTRSYHGNKRRNWMILVSSGRQGRQNCE